MHCERFQRPGVSSRVNVPLALILLPLTLAAAPPREFLDAARRQIGVTVQYRYEFLTPVGTLLRALAGGNLFLTLSETTVMALNPTV